MHLWGLFIFLSPQMVTKITIQRQGERNQREQMLVLSLVPGDRSVSLPLRMLSIMVSSSKNNRSAGQPYIKSQDVLVRWGVS